jgi:hypothetical protein
MNTAKYPSLLVRVIAKLVLQHGNSHCVILVDPIQTLMYFDDCSIYCCVTLNALCKCSSFTEGTDTSQRSYHNYSCETRAMGRFTKYRTIAGIIHNRWPSKYFLTMNWLHTTSGGMPLCFQVIVLQCLHFFYM